MKRSWLLALTAIGGVLLVASLLANPAGAQTGDGDDTCVQVGNEVAFDFGENRPGRRRVALRENLDNGGSRWVLNSNIAGNGNETRGEITVPNADASYSVRYIERITRDLIDVPCVVNTDPGAALPRLPRETVNCINRDGVLSWDGFNGGVDYQVREGDIDGRSSWVATSSRASFITGATGGEFFVRYRINGEVLNDPCILDEVAPDFCALSPGFIGWDEVAHDDDLYHLRQRLPGGETRWVTTTSDTFFRDADIDDNDGYLVRYYVRNGNGVRVPVDNICSP